MAKGDHTRVQQQVNQQGSTEQNSQNALQNMLYGQNLGFQNNYNTGTGTDFGTYNNVNNNYGGLFNALSSGQIGVGQGTAFQQPQQQQQQGGQNPFSNYQGNPTDPSAVAQYVQYLSQQPGADPTLASDPNYWIGKITDTGGLTSGNVGYWNNRSMAGAGNSGGGGGGGLNSALPGALEGFSQFSQTGGYSPQDLQSIRDQAVAANQGAYKTAQSNLNQNRELQQFSPNYAAASTNLARNMGYTNSNALTSANSAIAQMVQSGKLAGLQGMTGVGGLNNQAQGMNLNAMLGALGGNTSLYGAAPGMGATYGNQLLGSSNQMLGAQGTQNQIGGQLINGQLGESSVPGDFQQGLNNTLGGMNAVGGFLSPFLSFGS